MRKAKPYLTVVSFGRKYRYFDTRKKYKLKTLQTPFGCFLITSYRKVPDD